MINRNTFNSTLKEEQHFLKLCRTSFHLFVDVKLKFFFPPMVAVTLSEKGEMILLKFPTKRGTMRIPP